jgi:protein-S-isoprenylcysteine O-methyltransferase Ste14
VSRPLALLAAIGLVVVSAHAFGESARPGGVIPFVVVASFDAYVIAAELALGRARASRGPRVQSVGGIAQWAPAFLWVPYAVVAYHLGPEARFAEPVVAAGLALTLLGIALALWALLVIGRHFDFELEVHQDHEVVRSGPYAFVRHPIYTGLIVHTVGAWLATGNLALLVGSLLVTFPILYARARTEERLLRGQLGARYDAYARDVGMLVPFLGRGVA